MDFSILVRSWPLGLNLKWFNSINNHRRVWKKSTENLPFRIFHRRCIAARHFAANCRKKKHSLLHAIKLRITNISIQFCRTWHTNETECCLSSGCRCHKVNVRKSIQPILLPKKRATHRLKIDQKCWKKQHLNTQFGLLTWVEKYFELLVKVEHQCSSCHNFGMCIGQGIGR